jgi:hypothetical protein
VVTVAALTDTATVAALDAESEIVSVHEPVATGVTDIPFSVAFTTLCAMPVQPATENGAVPPEIVAFCAAAAGDVKLNAVGDIVIAAAAADTLAESVVVSSVVSAMVKMQLPAATGATEMFAPAIAAVAVPPQPDTV